MTLLRDILAFITPGTSGTTTQADVFTVSPQLQTFYVSSEAKTTFHGIFSCFFCKQGVLVPGLA